MSENHRNPESKQTENVKSGWKTHFLFNLLQSDVCLQIGVFLFSVVLFESMAPSRLSSANFGSDGGDFLTAVLTNGVPHPTGYPIYLLLSELCQKIPFGTPVWRQAQASILPAGICAVLFYSTLRFFPFSGNKLACSLTTLCLTVSTLFWSQAVIVEVYALHALFLSLALFWIAAILSQSDETIRKYLTGFCVIAFVGGFGIGNHTSILLMYPAIFYALWVFYKKSHSTAAAVTAFAGWFSGLILYIIIPLRAAGLPAVSWGDARSWSGFLWLVSGGDYHDYLFAILPHEYLQRVISFCGMLTDNFGYIGLISGMVGVLTFQQNRKFHRITVYVFFAYTIMAVGYKTTDSLVYSLPAMVCFAIWIFWGLLYLWHYTKWSLNIGIVMSIALAISLVWTVPTRYAQVDPRSGDLAHYAETTLSGAKPGEILYPKSDGETFALWYYQYALGMRREIVIVSRGLLTYEWYREQLERNYPQFDLNSGFNNF